MTEEFSELIKQNRVILNLKNCPCCFGTLARGTVLKQKFPEIILTATNGLNIWKKLFFPYPLIVTNFEKVIRKNNITLIIHDLKINFNLYNAGLKYKIPQYFIFANNAHKWQFNLFEKIIFPYPLEMAEEFKDVKNKLMAGLIVKEIDKNKIKAVRDKYEIGEKPVTTVTVSTGKHQNSEKLFQYAYDNFKDKYDLVFTYGISYKGKTFPVKSSVFEENLMELFSLSEKIISFGAYNTISEALSLRKEIISFPKPNNTGEEEVKRFAKYFSNIKILNL
jgi:hypothetical protein